MENQPQGEKAKVNTEEQISRISKRLFERAVKLDDKLRETNQFGPAAGSGFRASKVENSIVVDDYGPPLIHSLKHRAYNQKTGHTEVTVIKPEAGLLSAHVSRLDGGEGISKIAVDSDGNQLYTPVSPNNSGETTHPMHNSPETEHQMDDAYLRHTAAEALNRLRNELNRRG